MPASRQHIIRLFHLSLLASMALTGCSISRYQDGAPRGNIDVSRIPNAVPRVEPLDPKANPRSYTVLGRTYHVLRSARGYDARGIASWYGTKFHGHTTSDGEIYSMFKMTAAHKTLPIPSYAEVTNLKNGRKVIVRINDRGPFHPNRIIDLSYVAAKKLGIIRAGTGLVEVRSIDPRTWNRERLQPNPVQARYHPNHPTRNVLYLQAGAFASRNNAERLTRKLHALLPRHHIHMAYLHTDRLYHVRVGPLSGVDEADRLTRIISDRGYPEPQVVIE